ncbi:MAG: class I SAM-dependent methyltransferase [Bryobacteraceae bacterium]
MNPQRLIHQEAVPIGPSVSEQIRPDQYRHSHGLDQFLGSLNHADASPCQVLDIGEFTQANVAFIIGQGHRLTFEDLLRSFELPGVPAAERLNHALDFPPAYFDAILVWDILEHFPPPVAESIVPRLHRILRPGGLLFACFHAEARDNTVDAYSFRIADGKTLLLQPRGRRKLAQTLNNRSIEKLFSGFDSVKFFLTRDSIREVIVRK